MSGADDILTVAAAGDAMATRRLTRIEEEGFRELRRVVTDADTSVVNLEGPLHEGETAPRDRWLTFDHRRGSPTTSRGRDSTFSRQRITTSVITVSRG